jgi:uncharacterized membrane protein
MPRIRRRDLDRPWQWLNAGWGDLRKAGPISLMYGLACSLAGGILTAVIWALDWLHLVLPLMAGFMFMGPLLAVGLYYVSRELEAGNKPRLVDSMMAWRSNPQQLAASRRLFSPCFSPRTRRARRSSSSSTCF